MKMLVTTGAILAAVVQVTASVSVHSLHVAPYGNSTVDDEYLVDKRGLQGEEHDLFARGQQTLRTGGINWKRHRSKHYLRFVLASSVKHPQGDSDPVAISIANVSWQQSQLTVTRSQYG